MAWDVGDHILIPIPLHSTPHQLSNDMTFVHVDIEFIHLPSFPALLSSDVSMSVCVDVVVAPIYCSFMDAIAPSSTHTYLATLVFTVMDVGFMVIIKNISILVLVLVYGVLVFPYLHSAVTLLQAYAALLTLSISDMLAAPLQRNQLNEDQNTRIQHSILSPIAFIHDDWISPIRINTQSIHYTHAVTETIVVVLSYVCLFFTIDWYLFVALFIIFLVKSLVLNLLLSISTIHGSLQADRARTFTLVYHRHFCSPHQERNHDYKKAIHIVFATTYTVYYGLYLQPYLWMKGLGRCTGYPESEI